MHDPRLGDSRLVVKAKLARGEAAERHIGAAAEDIRPEPGPLSENGKRQRRQAKLAGVTAMSGAVPVPVQGTDTLPSSGSLLETVKFPLCAPALVGRNRASSAISTPGATLAGSAGPFPIVN